MSTLVSNTLPLRPDLHIDRTQLNQLCDRWQIVELALFGSVLRDDFRPDSDIDLLVQFSERAKITFFDLDIIEAQLSQLFGDRPIDLVTRNAIENSHNPIRRQNILSHTYTIYCR
ncbi:nucleotidyltransferase family protein [Roseofilum capinflatum]|uniref:Nucleotidyltransferase domain-containing protein n=1 Tax=Roseofilum capinflatum BLCC-M114 TaxID=3022440 RepID=A0ABT7B3M5_9CYAN|nr:nucleotidyltransferase domain-containing protein [Roseofilum capinflatum]MDJ1173735.1 nucleotidyltransferase domain-containing protein [Roseofilum capinflatum BLCC-M114]